MTNHSCSITYPQHRRQDAELVFCFHRSVSTPKYICPVRPLKPYANFIFCSSMASKILISIFKYTFIVQMHLGFQTIALRYITISNIFVFNLII